MIAVKAVLFAVGIFIFALVFIILVTRLLCWLNDKLHFFDD